MCAIQASISTTGTLQQQLRPARHITKFRSTNLTSYSCAYEHIYTLLVFSSLCA